MIEQLRVQRLFIGKKSSINQTKMLWDRKILIKNVCNYKKIILLEAFKLKQVIKHERRPT